MISYSTARANSQLAFQRQPRVAMRAVRCSAQMPLSGFTNRNVPSFKVGIMGDLHLEPGQMNLFNEARAQFTRHLSDDTGVMLSGSRIVQLGDLGGYKYKPGSLGCFETAKEFMDGFPTPSALILGNHDLEGEEFETDEENLAVWQKVFGQRHYWSAELGPALLVGISTTRFRSNKHSVHEVFIDEEQMQWLASTLKAAGDRPVVMFSHAPPMGSGLKVIQEVHVKNRCAWLNHSNNPGAFIELIRAYPNVRLWFSGHFHLSHNYSTSISVVGPTAFVQTGVIGLCNRDGFRHSRLLEGDEAGYRVYTLDHDTGNLRLDLQAGWWDKDLAVPIQPLDELLCDPSEGWLCSQLDCELTENEAPGGVQWFPAGPQCMLALQDGLLIEYDAPSRAPIGLVAPIPEGTTVELEGPGGRPPVAFDGSDVVAVVVKDNMVEGSVVARYDRNEAGGFYRIYQANKWRVKKEKERLEKEAAKQLQSVAAG